MKTARFNVTIAAIAVACLCLVPGCGRGGNSGQAAPVPVFTVGGTVTGLDGTLVLQINGGEELTINADGPFVFTTLLAEGAAFTVTARSQPSNQDVELTNYTGTINGGNVSGLLIACEDKAWDHPAGLNDNISPDLETAYWPHAAMNDHGDVLVVWYQSDGSDNQIFKSEYRGGAWTHPAGLEDNISPDGSSAIYPRAAMDNNGDAVIVWHQYHDAVGGYRIYMSERRSGAWTHPAGLTDSISLVSMSANSPRVAMDNNGNALIAWYQYDVGNEMVFKSEYRGGTWTHPSNYSESINPACNYAEYVRVAMGDNGEAVIVWRQRSGSYHSIFKSDYRNGAWTHPADTSDNIDLDGMHSIYPEVAMDDDGNTVIVWYTGVGMDTRVFKSEYRGGAWTHPASAADAVSPAGSDSYEPKVAVANGDAVIVWRQSDGAFLQVFMSECRNGSWAHPAGLVDNISPDGTHAVSPCPGMDRRGNTVIAWHQYDALETHIFMSEYRHGAWTHPAGIGDRIDPAGGIAYSTFVAAANNGDAVIFWLQDDGSNYQVFASEYR